jgi:hypothetical protein
MGGRMRTVYQDGVDNHYASIVQEGKVNIGAIEQFEIYNTAIIDQYGDSIKLLRYKREENSATQTQAGMVMPEYIKISSL